MKNILSLNLSNGGPNPELAEICMLFLQQANLQMGQEATHLLAFILISKSLFKLTNTGQLIQELQI
jgi:hypothetical protein